MFKKLYWTWQTIFFMALSGYFFFRLASFCFTVLHYDPKSLGPIDSNLLAIVINLVSSAVWAVLTVVALVTIYKFRFKIMAAGTYEAFDYDQTQQKYITWGRLEIKFHPFLQKFEFKLTNHTGDCTIDGTGSLVKEAYLIGTYVESKNPLRRRFASFFMVIDGHGTTIEGSYLYMDPLTSPTNPLVGKARWIKK
ncbi:hypothetical protein [Bdellovibrio svalbardensis]|uniref:SMODS-associating 2TM beta-strand rich effector domain-containing protein n=1 Tax=Bdellovibrio svalbardensis TaxID=2972972 RepID=A0ABT6DHW5_9BACT|nr:hypothetical protein [Bdellovibrio svalbardensis]MDG0816446.1 hypothetical protein [Bdellovibrio svalbardensis]